MTVNLLFGLPFSDDSTRNKLLSDFFALEGKHIVCGGTTAQYVANFLHKSLVIGFQYENPEIPPVSHIEGVDLVTEGIITMSAVLEKVIASAVVDGNQDGASLIYTALCEANEINFFVSSADNPANCEFPQLKTKEKIVESLACYLREFGKTIGVRHI